MAHIEGTNRSQALLLPEARSLRVSTIWMGRRLDNVRAEFSLTSLAYNIRPAITILGIPDMIAAVRRCRTVDDEKRPDSDRRRPHIRVSEY